MESRGEPPRVLSAQYKLWESLLLLFDLQEVVEQLCRSGCPSKLVADEPRPRHNEGVVIVGNGKCLFRAALVTKIPAHGGEGGEGFGVVRVAPRDATKAALGRLHLPHLYFRQRLLQSIPSQSWRKVCCCTKICQRHCPKVFVRVIRQLSLVLSNASSIVPRGKLLAVQRNGH